MSSKRFLTVVAWSTGAVSLAGFAAAWVLAVRNGDVFDFSAEFSPDRYMVAYAVAGTILASRRPGNPVGWFLLTIGLVTSLRGLAGEYALYALARPHHAGHPGGVWAAWYVSWSLTLLFPDGVLTFLLLLFPDGRPLTRRWWAVFWASAGLAASFLVITWLLPVPITLGGGLPLRRRVQALVDQRFDRTRYDAERVVTQFSVQLRDQVDLDVLGEDLRGVVDHVLAPEHLSLWLREPGPFG